MRLADVPSDPVPWFFDASCACVIALCPPTSPVKFSARSLTGRWARGDHVRLTRFTTLSKSNVFALA